MKGPMFLVEPPASATLSFETHLRVVDVQDVPLGAGPGLVIVRHDLLTLNLLEASMGFTPPRVLGTWWDVDGDGGGESGPIFADPVEELWLRFEHRGDTFGFAMKERVEDDWENITEHFRGSFPHRDFRFEPGSYKIGLFVEGGLEPQDDVQGAFDYFASPEVKTLGVEAAGKTAVAWAMVKQAAR